MTQRDVVGREVGGGFSPGAVWEPLTATASLVEEHRL